VLDRELVDEAQVADQLLEDVGRRGGDPPVVEIDHHAVGVERALDLRPVALVIGEGGRGTVPGHEVRADELRHGALGEDREGEARPGEPGEEVTTRGGGHGR